MKGIILAGGSGTRLYPITKAVSKQLLPIYDKPMIYYPLSVLMLAGIREVLIISTPDDILNFERLFGDGHNLGMEISYKTQPKPDGLAEAFIIGKDFIGNDSVCLILGDNLYYGQGFTETLINAKNITEKENKAVVFGYWVTDPERYGVVDLSEDGFPLSIEEKPSKPKSNYAVVGLYFYPNDVIHEVTKVKKSKRGELEISTLNDIYLKKDRLSLSKLGRGLAWFDTGTIDSLHEASDYVRAFQKRQGLIIACIEEIAYNQGFIGGDELMELSKGYKNTKYGNYLKNIL
jgi:glucose-1-phosphate thymidylyltransferase